MKIIHASLILFLILMHSQLAGQVKFNKTFGGSCPVEGTFVQLCHDSGYVIASTNCYGAYILRTNSVGDTLWTRTYSDSISQFMYVALPKIICIKETADLGFIMTGSLDMNGYCLRIDSAGHKLWSNDDPFAFPQNGTTFGNILVQDTGGYIISGYSDDTGPDNYAFYFGITDAGDTTYTHIYGSGGGSIQAFKQTSDGGIILLIENQNTFQYYLAKDGGSNGSWSQLINYTPECLLPLTGSGYVCGAYWQDQSLVYRWGLVRIDSLGDSLWSKDLGFIPHDIVPVNLPGDSGYVMIRNLYKPTQLIDPLNLFCEVHNSDIELVRTDLNGNILWRKAYGGSGRDNVSNLINAPDNGFSMVGYTRSESGHPEIIFIKTDSVGNDH